MHSDRTSHSEAKLPVDVNAHTGITSGSTEKSAQELAGPNKPDKSVPSKPAPDKQFHPYPFWAPRFWHGMRPLTWIGLLREGGFRVHPSRWNHLWGVSTTVGFNTLLTLIQNVWMRRRLANAELHGPPVFIVGHWRSGTTLLHELMVRDERYSSPSTFQCFAPHHFLVSEWAFQRFGSWLLPGKRPMDNMNAGWNRPQEDEFALMNLGLPSPYRRIAFPNNGPVDLNYLDFENVSEEDIETWLAALRRFMLAVSTVTGRPLVIKSPTHTGRIGVLAKAFPDARFIHMTRDPRALYPSTCRLWRSLNEIQGLQKPDHSGESEYVVECLARMYRAFERDRKEIEPHRLIDVRYEDLTANPVQTMQTIYETLHLSDFDFVRNEIETWAQNEHQDYRTNEHHLSPLDEAMLKEAWKEYFENYGYL
ncbi:sulfotransferase family protein [Stieleria varia]|uniref:Sulfotransferase domain protein n=1 Tax=Stieleria varia TaxID=2528005 RepID=A0A5C6AMF6_9BACT|nr:sulfotransferase [Stieleria varia]TWU00840.1 Sulfotransferase domain protein [Stieleria varia]